MCEYTGGRNNTTSSPRGTPLVIARAPSSDVRLDLSKRNLPVDDSNDSSQAESTFNSTSRRSSIGAPQAFMHDHHVGPTSGVSFLYHPWDKPQEVRGGLQSNDEGGVISQAPLISYGDISLIDPEVLGVLPEPIFTVSRIQDIMDRYFQYISPTYRHLHHPTAKKWAIAYVNRDQQLTAAQRACVLLVCAQTLLHTSAHPGDPDVGRGDSMMSMACSERAKAILDKEPGPPGLASVQARISMCLYLLSTFRLNECRYCFSFAATVATALGLHRKMSSTKVNSLEGECRKRTFWSLYVLDAYLSVMLGRPRLLRDEDIDQPYPYNIDDHDLISNEPIESLPQHGNLEAFINHAKLAKLTARNNDLLYPLHSLTDDELLQRSNEMLDALNIWQDGLPDFLKPRERTLTGQRTFERQNTILKLSLAHARILATRRCLLTDFGHVDANPFSQSQDARAKRSVRECITAIVTVLDMVEALIQHGQCYGSFWSTQYIALVAISTFYVIIIQGVRHALPGDIQSFLNVDECLAKARRCHEHLATLPPAGTQAERHHVLLAHLRSKAERSLAKHRSSLITRASGKRQRRGTDGGAPRQGSVHGSEINDTSSIANLDATYTSLRLCKMRLVC